MLDTQFVRSQFPALDTPWALFDNAGGTVAPRQVIDRVHGYMSRYQMQLGASYALSEEAGALYKAGHRAVAALFGADVDEVFLGVSTTRNMELLAATLRPQWREGDAIVVTDLDHEANVGCWRRLAATGIEVREWKLRPGTAELAPEDLEPLLDDRTRLVAVTHCSNIVGALVDIPAVVERAHAAGALVCVDGVGYAPHRLLDVKALGVDFYAFSLYKSFGPHLGAVYGRREHLLGLSNPNHFFIDDSAIPSKLEPGNLPYELGASLPGILDYLDAVDRHHGGDGFGDGEFDGVRAGLQRVFRRIAHHEAEVSRLLIEFLKHRDGVRIIGPATAEVDARAPIIAFVVEGRRSSEIPPLLDTEHLAVRFGHFYAYRGVEALGLRDVDGVVRVSLAHYNTAEEIERLVTALDRVL